MLDAKLKNLSKAKMLTYCAIFVALLIICAPIPIYIPFLTPVPVTLSVFVILLCGAVLGWRLGTAAVVIYLIMGAIGLPVFSGFNSGIAVLTGMTGGYIMGYIPLALIAGLSVKFFKSKIIVAVGMTLGVAACHLTGILWFAVYTNQTVGAAFLQASAPFIPIDIVKIIAAVAVYSRLNKIIR